MATVISGNKIKLNNGQTVTAQTGGWYDGQQFWGGTLSQPGVINSQSNQPGAGQAVSREVVAQTSPENVSFLAKANPALPYAAEVNAMNGITTPTSVSGTTTTTSSGITPVSAPTAPSETQQKMDSLQASIQSRKDEANKRMAEVNDNPFLSEASRVGRINKIQSMLNDSLQTDQEQLAYLQKLKEAEDAAAERAAERAAEAAKPDYQIISETDNAGNLTIITIDKKTGAIVSQVSGGKVGKTSSSSGGGGGSTNILQSYILTSAQEVDQKYQTIGGELKTGDTVDKFGTKIGSYVTGGDKMLSQQEFDLAEQDAYTKALANKSFTGTKAEFDILFTQTLKENGYTAWGN